VAADADSSVQPSRARAVFRLAASAQQMAAINAATPSPMSSMAMVIWSPPILSCTHATNPTTTRTVAAAAHKKTFVSRAPPHEAGNRMFNRVSDLSVAGRSPCVAVRMAGACP